MSLATDLHKNFVTLGAQAGIGQTRAIIKRKVLFIERLTRDIFGKISGLRKSTYVEIFTA